MLSRMSKIKQIEKTNKTETKKYFSYLQTFSLDPSKVFIEEETWAQLFFHSTLEYLRLFL